MDSSSLPSNPNILTNNGKRKTTISSSSSCDQISSPNITFVQADPSNFRAVVQKLTGADQQPHLPSRYTGKPTSGEMGPLEPPFKLLERRQKARKLKIKLHNGVISLPGCAGEIVMGSPVSPLEIFGIRSVPRTPRSPSEEEERAISGKGFYLHPSPMSSQRVTKPPELLSLFPLSSPRDDSPTSS